MQNRLIQGLESVGRSLRGCVLTIGNFDGVHLGHRRILRTARPLADEAGLPVAALTFDPPPDLVLRPDDVPERITPHAEKCRLLLDAGADYVVTAGADKQLLSMSSAEFVERVIVGRFAPRHVVEGHNFFFGLGRSGNVETLAAAGKAAGFILHVVEPVMQDLPEGPVRVSSTLIRRLVLEGGIAHANRCLGRDFSLYGRVSAGEGRGRVLEFPTANISVTEQVCPADGVYAGLAEIAGERFAAAISIGEKSTFGPGGERAVEAFLLNAGGDYYDEYMVLSFIRRLRGQRRFDTAGQLRAQIAKDVERVREICK